MKIVFMGTPEFAKAALQALVENGYDVPLVLTQPDKPKGRGYTLTPSDVKRYALEQGLRVETPATLKDAAAEELLRSVGADVFVVAAYGKLLPENILHIPRLGCVNIHASLLPAWRGAAPLQRAIMNGDTVGGVSMMYMDVGLDTGDIILQKKIDIPSDMTAGEYHDKMAVLGAQALLEFLALAEQGEVPRFPQTGNFTYAEKLTKNDRYVSFEETAEQTHNRIRGLSPAPSAYSMLNGKQIKLLASHVADGKGEPGEVLRADKNGIEVACKTGSVVITVLQPEGKGKLDAASFVNGLQKKEGLRFHV